MICEDDRRYLERTLELAFNGRVGAAPNPLVGAIVVAEGVVLAEGYHHRAGAAHGEVVALDAIPEKRRGLTSGATLYLNLEPCCHRGRTAACTDRILAAGISRVVCCHRDPNPVARGGEKLLVDAGVRVEFLDPSHASHKGLLERAVLLNARFLWPLLMVGPLVTLKWAMSLDGKIATRTGDSQWISSPPGRRWALELRELHDAILVGSGTALVDDPRLNRRSQRSKGAIGGAAGEILRVVMDRRLRWQPPAAMFTTDGDVLVFTSQASVQGEGRLRREKLEEAGAQVVPLAEVTPQAVVEELGSMGVGSLLVEGGAGILGAFVDQSLCHRVGVCCAPILIGGSAAPNPVAGIGREKLVERIELAHTTVRQVGSDCVVEGVERKCLQDLLSSVAES